MRGPVVPSASPQTPLPGTFKETGPGGSPGSWRQVRRGASGSGGPSPSHRSVSRKQPSPGAQRWLPEGQPSEPFRARKNKSVRASPPPEFAFCDNTSFGLTEAERGCWISRDTLGQMKVKPSLSVEKLDYLDQPHPETSHSGVLGPDQESAAYNVLWTLLVWTLQYSRAGCGPGGNSQVCTCVSVYKKLSQTSSLP